jgi:hypothetical protein
LAFAATGAACCQPTSTEQQTLSDSEIRLLFVRVSTAAYTGECACPESVNSRGMLCGGNSAYRRGGGNRPLCYSTDVTDDMIRRYREALAKQ